MKKYIKCIRLNFGNICDGAISLDHRRAICGLHRHMFNNIELEGLFLKRFSPRQQTYHTQNITHSFALLKSVVFFRSLAVQLRHEFERP